MDSFPTHCTSIGSAIRAFKATRDIRVICRLPILNVKETKHLLARIEEKNNAGANFGTDGIDKMCKDILINKIKQENKNAIYANIEIQISIFHSCNFRNK